MKLPICSPLIFPPPIPKARRRNKVISQLIVAVGLGALSALPSAEGATLIYTATDLADATPDEDLWQYDYRASDLALTTGQGFTIYFDRVLYAHLETAPLPGGDWDTLVAQPDLALNSDGFFDAQARRNAPSSAQWFTVEFVWLGVGSPAFQPFTIYDVDFSTLSLGQTAVPEPSATALLLASLGCLRWRRRQREAGLSAFVTTTPKSQSAHLC